MSSQQLIQKPDIKLSVKQTFGFDSEMKVGGFFKKMIMSQILILITNSIKIQHLQY